MKVKNVLLLALFIAFGMSATAQSNDKVKTIKLVETPGQFETKKIDLKPGKYQFEVTNKNVDHEVAFFLQKQEDKGSGDFATAVPNSGLPKTLKAGESATTGIIDLAAGQYVYSCPLNPTDHYVITVK